MLRTESAPFSAISCSHRRSFTAARKVISLKVSIPFMRNKGCQVCLTSDMYFPHVKCLQLRNVGVGSTICNTFVEWRAVWCFQNCWRSGPRPSHHTFGEDIEPSRQACRRGFVGENQYSNYQANTNTWHELSTEQCGCLISIAFHPTFEILRGMQNISWTRKHGSNSQSRMLSYVFNASFCGQNCDCDLPHSSTGNCVLLDRFQDCFLLRCVKGSGSRSILLTISSYSDYNFENSSLCFSSLTATARGNQQRSVREIGGAEWNSEGTHFE